METSFKYFILATPPHKKTQAFGFEAAVCSPNMTSSTHKRTPASAICVSALSLKPLLCLGWSSRYQIITLMAIRACFSCWPQCSGWYLKPSANTLGFLRLALKPTCWPRAT